MIGTVTANPCIDKTLVTEKFDLYKMNRVRVLRSDFGGKGINVSAAVSSLGGETLCTGLAYQTGEESFCKFLKERHIPCDFVVIPGNMRTCYKLFDESLRHTIEINEYGTQVDPSAQELLLEKCGILAQKCTFITLSGSLPKGFSPDFYARCARRIKEENPSCRILVDAEKSQLIKALETNCISCIKPNIHEFQSSFSLKGDSPEQLDEHMQRILKLYNLEFVCISLGADGTILTDGKETFFCEAPQVTVRSIQGAGDSLIAGIGLGLEQNKTLDELLLYAVCAAGDSISKEGTQMCTAQGVEQLLKTDPPALRKIR